MNENVDIAKAQADEENIENELNDIYSSIDELSKADNVDKVIEEAKTVEIEEEKAADEEIEKKQMRLKKLLKFLLKTFKNQLKTTIK